MSRPPASCHPDREHLARGLCGPCYRRARYDGTIDRHESTPRTPGAAVLRISRAYGVTLPDLLGDSTEPHLVDARRAAAHLLRDQLGLTQRAIAHWLGGRTQHHVLKLLADPPPRPSDPSPLPDDGTCHVHEVRARVIAALRDVPPQDQQPDVRVTAGRRALPPQLARAGGRRG